MRILKRIEHPLRAQSPAGAGEMRYAAAGWAPFAQTGERDVKKLNDMRSVASVSVGVPLWKTTIDSFAGWVLDENTVESTADRNDYGQADAFAFVVREQNRRGADPKSKESVFPYDRMFQLNGFPRRSPPG